MCMDNIPMDLNELDYSSVLDSTRVTVNTAVITVEFPNFYSTFLFSWLDLFARLIR